MEHVSIFGGERGLVYGFVCLPWLPPDKPERAGEAVVYPMVAYTLYGCDQTPGTGPGLYWGNDEMGAV